MELKRVEVLVNNVHTSKGKLLQGMRETLPREEANQLIKGKQCRGIRGTRPKAEPEQVPEFDYANLTREQLEGLEQGDPPEQGDFDLPADDTETPT